MLPPDQPHATIRAIFEAADFPPGTAIFPGTDADGVLPADGIDTPFELARIEALLAPRAAAETAVSLADHVASGEVVAALAHHKPGPSILEPFLHRLEVRLRDFDAREGVWRHLAARGLDGYRWLTPPCRLDIWKYAVVQGPIGGEDWERIVHRTREERCSHLVVLGDAPPKEALQGFEGSLDIVVDRPSEIGKTLAPCWLETAAVGFYASEGALEKKALGLLYGRGRETTVVRSPRRGFLRCNDQRWGLARHLELEQGVRCLVGPGPYADCHDILVVSPRDKRVTFRGSSFFRTHA